MSDERERKKPHTFAADTGSERAASHGRGAGCSRANRLQKKKNGAMPEGEAVGFPPPHAAGALHLPICPLTASATSMSEST